MRSRRNILIGSAAIMGSTAGCSGVLESENDEGNDPPSSDLPEAEGPAFETPPEIEWDESIVSGRSYQVTARISFEDADEVRFETYETVVNTISRSDVSGGTVQVAGQGTEYGTAEAGDIIEAYVPNEEFDRMVSSHFVGSIVEPDPIAAHLTGLSGDTAPDLSNTDMTQQEFEYTLNGRRYSFSPQIPSVLLDYYEEREQMGEFGAYVADPFQHSYLSGLADEFERIGDSSRETVDHAMSFVQNLEYTADEISTGFDQYTYYPVETLNDAQGDCEDTTILLAGILRQLGYGCVLLGFWDEQHMALGVAGEDSLPGSYYEYEGTQYYYTETTAPGWEVGDVPNDLAGASAEIIEVRDHPILVFRWTTAPSTEGGVIVETQVQNVGSATARSVQVHAEFENRSGQVQASNRSETRRIAPDSTEEFSVRVTPPADEELRGRTAVLLDGNLHDKAVTDWREPLQS